MYMVNCTEPLNLQVHVYVVALMKEMGGRVENGKSETRGVVLGMIGGRATGVGLSEEDARGTGICCALNWQLMLPNTQSINRL